MTSETVTGLAPGTRIGPFALLRRVGQGTFGAVYEAVKHPLGKRVALKILHRERAGSGQVVERFFQEARAAAALKHLHIVDVDDIGIHDGVPYIAMEFLPGESLAAHLGSRHAPLAPAEALDLLLPICSAVASVHDASIVHRDIKPDNIFLWADRPGHVHPKLLDFGIAKLNDGTAAQMTATGASLGTPLYMAPEQWRGSKHATAASDQWALAAIAYQCLTLSLPFHGSDVQELMFKVLSEPVPPLRASVPGLDPRLEVVLLRALEKRPEARYPSVRDFARALLPWAGSDARTRWASEFGDAAAPAYVGSFAATMEVRQPPAPPAVGVSSAGPFESSRPSRAPSSMPPLRADLSNEVVRGGTLAVSPPTAPVASRRRSPLPLALGIAVGGSLLGLSLFFVFRKPTPTLAVPVPPTYVLAAAPTAVPAAPTPAPAAATQEHAPAPAPAPEPAPAPVVAAPEPAPAPSGGGGMDGARACMSAGGSQSEVNRCIVGALRSSASAEPELRLLCVTYRQMGDRANATSCMRRYIQRNPNTRFSDQFQEYISGG